ncbi:hypothetical protein WMY93_012955 [Mugilogobius chulae]|uniref:Soluble lamin-associated protein of 75 kDa-like n=1 Tax=Mugilogobius chulae TaxID=88201 RepID=A0AAW0PA96_9GOBI
MEHKEPDSSGVWSVPCAARRRQVKRELTRAAPNRQKLYSNSVKDSWRGFCANTRMKFPVDLLAAVSHSELEQRCHSYMSELLFKDPENPEQLTLPDSSVVDISISSVGLVPLYGSCDTQKVLALFAPADPFTPVALYILDRWWSVTDLLHTAESWRDGLVQVDTVGERIVLYVLNRIVYRVQEMSQEELPFLCHGEDDFAKILWKNGEAVGFYSVKVTGSPCSSFSSRTYPLPVMDSMFLRKSHRGKGLGLCMLEDYVDSFKEDYLGLRYPLTTAMYKVCQSYLRAFPGDSELLWEVDSSRLNQRTSIASRIQNMSLRGVSRTLTYSTESTVTGTVHHTHNMEEVTIVKVTKGAGAATQKNTDEQSSTERRISDEVLRLVQDAEMVQTEELLKVTSENGTNIVVTELEEDIVFEKLSSIRSEEENMTLDSEEVTQTLNTLCSSVITVENVAAEVEECLTSQEHHTEESMQKTAPLEGAVTMQRVLRTRTVVNIPQLSTEKDVDGNTEKCGEPVESSEFTPTETQDSVSKEDNKDKEHSSVKEDVLDKEEEVKDEIDINAEQTAVTESTNAEAVEEEKAEETSSADVESAEAEDREQIEDNMEMQKDSQPVAVMDVNVEESGRDQESKPDSVPEELLETTPNVETRSLRSGPKTIAATPRRRHTAGPKIAELETPDSSQEEPQSTQDSTGEQPKQCVTESASEVKDTDDAQSETKILTEDLQEEEESPQEASNEASPVTPITQENLSLTETEEVIETRILRSGARSASTVSTPRTTRSRKQVEEVIVEKTTKKQAKKSTGRKRVSRSKAQSQELEASSAEEDTPEVAQIETVEQKVVENTEIIETSNDKSVKDSESTPGTETQDSVSKEDSKDQEPAPGEKDTLDKDEEKTDTTMEETAVTESTGAEAVEEEKISSTANLESVLLTTTEEEDTEQTESTMEMEKDTQPESMLEVNVEAEQGFSTDKSIEDLETTVLKEDSKDQEPTPVEDTLDKEKQEAKDETHITMDETAVAKSTGAEAVEDEKIEKISSTADVESVLLTTIEAEDMEQTETDRDTQSEAKMEVHVNVDESCTDKEPEPDSASEGMTETTPVIEASDIAPPLALTDKENLSANETEEVVETRTLRSGTRSTSTVSTPRTTRSSKQIEVVVEKTTKKQARKSAGRKRVSRSKVQKQEPEASSEEDQGTEEAAEIETAEQKDVENNGMSSPSKVGEEETTKDEPVKDSEATPATEKEAAVTESTGAVAVEEEKTEEASSTADVESTLLTTAKAEDTAQTESTMETNNDIQPEDGMEASDKCPEVASDEAPSIFDQVSSSLNETQEVVQTRTLRRGARSTSTVSTPRTTRSKKQDIEVVVEKTTKKQPRRSAGRKQVSRSKKQKQELEASSEEDHSTEEAQKESTEQIHLENNEMFSPSKVAEEETTKDAPVKDSESTLATETQDTVSKEDSKEQETAPVEDKGEEEAKDEADITEDETGVTESTSAEAVEGEKTEEATSTADVSPILQITSEAMDTEQTESTMEIDNDTQSENEIEINVEVSGADKPETDSAPASDKCPEVAHDEPSATVQTDHENSSLSETEEVVQTRTLRSGARSTSTVSTPRTTRSRKQQVEEVIVEKTTRKQARKSTGRKRVSRSKAQSQELEASSAEEDTSEEAQTKSTEEIVVENKEISSPSNVTEDETTKNETIKDSESTSAPEFQESVSQEDSKETAPVEDDTLAKDEKEINNDTNMTVEETAITESTGAEAVEKEKTEEPPSTADVESVLLTTTEAEDTEQIESTMEMDKDIQPEAVSEVNVEVSGTDNKPESDSAPASDKSPEASDEAPATVIWTKKTLHSVKLKKWFKQEL